MKSLYHLNDFTGKLGAPEKRIMLIHSTAFWLGNIKKNPSENIYKIVVTNLVIFGGLSQVRGLGPGATCPCPLSASLVVIFVTMYILSRKNRVVPSQKDIIPNKRLLLKCSVKNKSANLIK